MAQLRTANKRHKRAIATALIRAKIAEADLPASATSPKAAD